MSRDNGSRKRHSALREELNTTNGRDQELQVPVRAGPESDESRLAELGANAAKEEARAVELRKEILRQREVAG